MKATLTGEFGSATIDLPDYAKDDPAKLQAYVDTFEKNAAAIKSGAMPLPDFDSFQSSKPGFSPPGRGMGDLKMAESQPAQSVRDPWMPGRAQLEADALAQGKKVNPLVGALTSVTDIANIPSRAAAQFRGEDMADPNAYFWRPEVEALKTDTTGQGKMAEQIQRDIPPMTGGPMGMPMAPGLEYMGLPSAQNAVLEGVGQIASDPLLIVSEGGKIIARLTRKGLEAMHAAIPGLKNYISGLSQVKQPLLEKAASAEGMASLKEGARMSPEDLAQQVATDAGKVNKYREDLGSNSRTTQQQQVQSINDDLALENQGINARATAEAEQKNARNALENQQVNANLADEAEKRTRYLQDLAANSKQTQQQQAELNILDARQKATGAEAATLSDIKPGALGEDIKSGIMGGKGDMQDAWVQGDRESVGPYRSAPAAMSPPISDRYQNKLLADRLGQVQEKYKALDPNEGMRRISEGAASALSDLAGHAQNSGHTVDDLLNIKAELRRIRGMDKYKGIPFDGSTDDVALGDAEKAINDVITVSVGKAAPKQAGTIMDMMRAKDRQYAISKDYLGDLARTMGQTPNSAAIIQKVKALGPEKARAFIAAAEGNPAIASMVPKLRQAFVDDLILSSMKDGEFSAADFSKKWSHPALQEMKAAWLAPEDLQRIDEATALGTAEIGRPPVVNPSRVAMPARVEPNRVPMPPKVGSPADRSDGFYSRLAREEVGAPPKVGQSFSYNGDPDPITAKTRVQNIGNENEINQRALQDLQVLDKINKTDYANKAMQIFEAGKLGMNTEGALAAHPLVATGRAGYGLQKGQVIGRVVGGIGGGLLGYLAGHGVGAAAGTGPGAILGDMVAHMHSNLASPAGAVAAYRKLNAVLEARYPRAAKIAAALDKTSNAAQRARLMAMLQEELAKSKQSE